MKLIAKVISMLVLVIFILGIGIQCYAEGQQDLRKLRSTLKKQEKQVVKEEPVSSSKSVSPMPYIDSKDNAKIEGLYKKAEDLFQQGKLEDAKACLEKIIGLNPLHMPARNFLKRVVDRQTELLYKDNTIANRGKMLNIDRMWFPPNKESKIRIFSKARKPVKTKRQAQMEKKVKQIIPEINFTDAHIRDILKYLSDISGINIIIDEDLFPKEILEKMPEKIEVGRVKKEGSSSKVIKTSQPILPISDRITISLTNIPLIDALKYILSAKGLAYRIDEYAVVVSTPERIAKVKMETRYYHLSTGTGAFTKFVKKTENNGGQFTVKQENTSGVSKKLKIKERITIKDVLEESGVPFPEGSKVFLDKRTGTLIVRNTPDNLVLVEKVLSILDIIPIQVQIEARFIEVKQSVAQELGLEWMIKGAGWRFGNRRQLRLDSSTADSSYGQYPSSANWTGKEGFTHGLRYLTDTNSITGKTRNLDGSISNALTEAGEAVITKHRLTNPTAESVSSNPAGNILSISGMLTDPQFRMILHALNQTGNANLLSAPRVTTLNNQQAQIHIAKEIIYPTEFELTPATTNDYGTVVTQPVVTPSAWDTRDVGITLDVIPSVGADGKTITLSLHPEVSSLQGWDNYGIAKSEGQWSEIPILQPRFSKEAVDTNVVIYNNETVVLGGLIREKLISTNDKIPLLGDIPLIGRLFRNKTKQTEKTNLIIFVTANLLTPSGEHVKK